MLRLKALRIALKNPSKENQNASTISADGYSPYVAFQALRAA
jgi:hypothetical protein